jgi:hypothetical protein
MALFRSTTRILDSTLITTENSATNSAAYSTSVNCAIVLPPGTWIIEMLAKVVASAAGTPATASAKYQPVFSGTSTMDGIYMAAGYRADAYLGNATLAGTENASRVWNFENNANFASFYAILDYRRFRANAPPPPRPYILLCSCPRQSQTMTACPTPKWKRPRMRGRLGE